MSAEMMEMSETALNSKLSRLRGKMRKIYDKEVEK